MSDKRRIGRFYVSTKAVTSGFVAEILSNMCFVPYRVEHLPHMGKFEFIGTSKLFNPVDIGEMTPCYEIEVSEHPDSDVDEMLVTVKVRDANTH